MANNIVHGDSIEAVAYALYLDCMVETGSFLDNRITANDTAEERIALFGRCLEAVRAYGPVPLKPER